MSNLSSGTKKSVFNKCKLKIRILAIPSILLFFCLIGVCKGSEVIAEKVCTKPIGRVYSSGDSNLRVGSLICSGESIKPVKGRIVKALCFLNGKFLYFKQSAIFDAPDFCTPLNTPSVCTGRNPSRCNNAKGPGEDQNAPVLISPYGSSMLSARPQISWTPVSKATSYTVIVSGYEFYWEITVDKNTTILPYPKDQRELQFGNTYKITILANVDNIPISSSESLVVTVLRQQEQDSFAERVKQIKELNLPPDEVVIWDLDAVYMSRNLLNETIEALKARIASGVQNPTVYRLLADRYLEAWLPNEAIREYNMAAELAKDTNNTYELDRVQEGLKIIEWYKKK